MPLVSFTYSSRRKARRVVVAGTWNQWNSDAFPLTYDAERDAWIGSAEIEPGSHRYRLLVNGTRWICDPRARRARDANDNPNSLLLVEPDSYAGKPGLRGDGVITEDAVLHRSESPWVVRRSEREWVFELSARANDVESVVWVGPGGARHEMVLKSGDELAEIWRVSVLLDEAPGSYHFVLVDGGYELKTHAFELNTDCFPVAVVPEWVRGQVFYQIFPDRFATGGEEKTELWGHDPKDKRFFGGDIQGICERLDYLVKLGVQGLYLTPIFRAKSYHAYDTFSYKEIDPHFGTQGAFNQMVKEAHGAGIRVMLDAVFNHCGTEFFAFQDVREKGAQSPYTKWFFDLKHPVDPSAQEATYRSWAGVRAMPKLNQDNPACREYFLGIGRKWIRESGIDAWRLDVANEVSMDFWRTFRTSVREENPETYILGENWEDSRPWLQGDQWDSTMNYRWTRATLDVLRGRLSAPAYASALTQIQQDYPEAIEHVLFNLLGSHDTARVATVLGDPRKVDLAFALLLTHPGVPCIYYGDEVGMEGGHDPDCRRCMDWSGETWNLDRLELVTSLVKLRRDLPALQTGSTTMAGNRNGIFRTIRKQNGVTITIEANLKDRAQRVAKQPGDILLSRGYDAATHQMDGFGFRILRASG